MCKEAKLPHSILSGDTSLRLLTSRCLSKFLEKYMHTYKCSKLVKCLHFWTVFQQYVLTTGTKTRSKICSSNFWGLLKSQDVIHSFPVFNFYLEYILSAGWNPDEKAFRQVRKCDSYFPCVCNASNIKILWEFNAMVMLRQVLSRTKIIPIALDIMSSSLFKVQLSFNVTVVIVCLKYLTFFKVQGVLDSILFSKFVVFKKCRQSTDDKYWYIRFWFDMVLQTTLWR